MTKLEQLIESALAKEDGTVADLGPAPTGHIEPEKDKKIIDIEEVE